MYSHSLLTQIIYLPLQLKSVFATKFYVDTDTDRHRDSEIDRCTIAGSVYVCNYH